MNNAQIVGIDARECPCCGGIEISIENVPNPSGNNYFLASQLPQGFNLGANPTFPIAIKLDWKKDTAGCFGNYISVLRIAKR